jgi:hypothetical protein
MGAFAKEPAMNRFSLAGIALPLIAAATVTRLWAAAPAAAPQRPIALQSRVLESLIGTWDVQVSGGTSENFEKPLPAGRVERRWVAHNKYVREQSDDHQAFITYDPQQNMYRAWYFHRNGHVWQMSGRFTHNFRRLALTTELDLHQSMSRIYQVLDDKNQECSITWTDENGRTGVYGVFKFKQSPVEAKTTAGKKPGAADVKVSPPPELGIFDREIGKWTFESKVTADEKTTKVAGSSEVRWILGGRFEEIRATVDGREGESIYLVGFDAATKSYRRWSFEPEGIMSEPEAGAWDEKQRTMTWTTQKTPFDLTLISKRQWIDDDTVKMRNDSSTSGGTDTTTLEGTSKRQKGK